MNNSLHAALVNFCTSEDDPLSHSCRDGVVVRKMFPDCTVGVVEIDGLYVPV
jgi:hypothetical protein